jgi:Trypsin
MKKLLTLAAGLVAGLALIVTPAGAVTGNFQKDFVHTYVGLIVFYDAAGEFSHRCSGSLIAPRVFLTAGHCTEQDNPEAPHSARVWFRQDAGAEFNGVIDPDTGYPETCITDDPGRVDDVCVTVSTQAQLRDFGFDNFAGFPNHRDVGIAILDTPVTTLGFGQLPAPNLVTTLAANMKKNQIWLTSSGYGISDVKPVVTSFRERLMVDSYIVNLHNQTTAGFNIQSTANPGGGKGGTCSGDSGGPVLLRGTNTIVAVTSFGKNANCAGLDFSYRIDRPEVLAWIAANSS